MKLTSIALLSFFSFVVNAQEKPMLLDLGGYFSESQSTFLVEQIKEQMGSSANDLQVIEVTLKKGCRDGVRRECSPIWGQPGHSACSIVFCDEATYKKFSKPCYDGDPMGGAPHLCIDPNFHYEPRSAIH